ncbi:MAG: hypothetical protein ABS904_00785 [Solibacillus isronensis]
MSNSKTGITADFKKKDKGANIKMRERHTPIGELDLGTLIILGRDPEAVEETFVTVGGRDSSASTVAENMSKEDFTKMCEKLGYLELSNKSTLPQIYNNYLKSERKFLTIYEAIPNEELNFHNALDFTAKVKKEVKDYIANNK